MVMIFGQMNEPSGQLLPGGKCRADNGRILSGRRTSGRPAAHRQYFPIHSSGFGGIWIDGANAFPSRVPAHHGNRALRIGGAHRQYRNRRYHLHSSGLCPGGRFHRPGSGDTFSHLSASIVLSRDRASEGLFPAIDALQSSSKMATPGIAGERHYNLAQEIRRTLAQYEELKDIIAMLGLEQLSSEDRKVVARARRLERFLTLPFLPLSSSVESKERP